MRGATRIAIFDGTMKAPFYQTLLQRNLVPFIEEKYPDGHRFWQDNAPTHQAISSQQFYAANNINWWRTPAQSPVII